MELTSEQIREIKSQLIEQINSTFPEDKKSEAIEKIDSMNNSELVEFLKQNNMLKDPNSGNNSQKCIF